MKFLYKYILLLASFFLFPFGVFATNLNPGELFIVTVNGDSAFNGGVNSNAFDFFTTVDLDPGTQIYFTDIGWTGTTWRNPTGEGIVRYTAPAGGLAQGTIVHYDDSLSASAPWERLALNATTGVLTSGGAYDPAISGDNILVFQASDPLSPSFIYGIGWASTNPWISSGIASSNNSYIPAPLSAGTNTLVTLGNQDNYQYNCSVLGLYSVDLSSSIANPVNWNQNDTTAFGSSPCVIDTTRPEVLTIQRQNPTNANTNASSLTFRVEFSENVQNVSVDDFVLALGSLTGTISSVSEISPNIYDVSVTGYSGVGTINVDISSAQNITNSAGNPLTNVVPTTADETYTVDTIAPAVPVVTSPVSVIGNLNPTIQGTAEMNSTIELIIDATTYIVTTSPTGEWSITVSHGLSVAEHPYTVTATDSFGNTSTILTTSLTIAQYSVLFLDYDGTVINTQNVLHGVSVIAPADPTRSGYTFNGWGTLDFSNIVANTSYTAQYTQNPSTESNSSSSSTIRYTCKDPKATNYNSFGRHKASLCIYTATAASVPTPGAGLGTGETCSVDRLLTQNMKAGARNGRYHSYTKAIVQEVKILQAHMNRLGFESGPVDGILGPITDGAIKRMQIFLGTQADGFVGPITRSLINKSC